MAQAGSAQREPSMEEILASIRRIIEDGDPVSEREAVPTEADNDHASRPQPSAEVHSFRDGLRGSGVAENLEAANEADRSALDTGEEPAVALAEDEITPSEEDFAAEPADDRASAPAAAHDADDAEEPGTRHEAEAASAPAPQPAETGASAWSTERAREEDYSPVALAQEARSDTGGTEQRQAIISDFAERKVAAAFEELTGAFEANRRKSFDEMAEEMLRPMLQDWLDNNLPGLVERLVREEIERVARGSTR